MKDKREFLTLLAALAEECNRQLSKETVALYDEALRGHGYETLCRVLRSIIFTRRGRDFFPSIGDIKNAIEPTMDVAGATQELLTNSIRAVKEFGYYDAEGARRYLGEAVWAALPGTRGWREFCAAGDEESGGVSIATARAQLRDRISSQLKREFPSGIVRLPPPIKVPQRTLILFVDTDEKHPDKELRMINDR